MSIYPSGVGCFQKDFRTSIETAILEGAKLAGVDPATIHDWTVCGGVGIPQGYGLFFGINWPNGRKIYKLRHNATASDVCTAIRNEQTLNAAETACVHFKP